MRRGFLIAILAFTGAWLHATAQDTAKPNILLIYVDDLNYAGNAIDGHDIPTPNVQRIVDSGVNFSNAHANGVICSPSRASMLTGIQQYNSGYYGYRMGQNPWFENPILSAAQDMFDLFSNNGYNTYGSGKIFHGGSDSQNSFTEFNDVGPNGPWAWDGVSMAGNRPERQMHPSMPEVISGLNGFVPLSDVPSINGYTGWINADGTPFHYENDSVRDLLNDELVRDYFFQKIANTPADEPFFMTLGFSRPHTPFYLPEKYYNMHPIDEVVLPPILQDDLDDVPVAFINNRWNWKGNYDGYRELIEASAGSDDQHLWLKKYYQGYMAGVSFIDDLVGQVLDSLENSPFAENTYVILTSDHGYHLGEKTLIRKTTLYDAVTRVPFLVSGPDVAEGTVSTTPVSLVDVYPTLIDLAGLPNPWHQLDGHSIRPLLEDPVSGTWSGPSVALSSVASSESVPLFNPMNALHQHHSVRSENFRYTLYASGEEELYDYTLDPNEWFNLAGDPQYASEKEALRAKLLELTGLDGLVQEPASSFDALFHGNFEQDYNGWIVPGSSGSSEISVVTNQYADGTEKYAQITALPWYSIINNNLILENGNDYILSFTARSQAQESSIVVEVEQNGLPNFQNIVSEQFELTTTMTYYERQFTYTLDDPPYNSRLKVTFLDEDTYDLDNFRVRKKLTESDTSRVPTGPVIADLPAGQSGDLLLPVIDIYPTIVLSEMLELRFNISDTGDSAERLQVRIYNLQGKQVHSTHIHSSQSSGAIDLPNMDSGIYIVNIIGKRLRTNRKIVVQ